MTDDLLKGNLNKKRNSETYLGELSHLTGDPAAISSEENWPQLQEFGCKKLKNSHLNMLYLEWGLLINIKPLIKIIEFISPQSYHCQIQSTPCLGGGRIWEDWTKKHVSV